MMTGFLCRSTSSARTALTVSLLLCAFPGCEAQQTPEETSQTAIRTPVPASTQQAVLTAEAPDTPEPIAGLKAKIKFKHEDGSTAFSVKPEDDGAKLVDADEKEIARFNVSGAKLKIKDPQDMVLGYVIFSDGKYKVENADQSQELWKLQPQSDGDWKFENGDGLLIYKLMKREYGFEIEDGKENSLSKIKLKSGKTSLRDSTEKTILSTKDQVPTLGFACLGLDATDSPAIKAALMTMVIYNSR